MLSLVLLLILMMHKQNKIELWKQVFRYSSVNDEKMEFVFFGCWDALIIIAFTLSKCMIIFKTWLSKRFHRQKWRFHSVVKTLKSSSSISNNGARKLEFSNITSNLSFILCPFSKYTPRNFMWFAFKKLLIKRDYNDHLHDKVQ